MNQIVFRVIRRPKANLDCLQWNKMVVVATKVNLLATSGLLPPSQERQLSHHNPVDVTAPTLYGQCVTTSPPTVQQLSRYRVGCSLQDEDLPPLGQCRPYNTKVGLGGGDYVDGKVKAQEASRLHKALREVCRKINWGLPYGWTPGIWVNSRKRPRYRWRKRKTTLLGIAEL